ncbi:hypothetical protein Bca4012_064401 [Brassica carinata]
MTVKSSSVPTFLAIAGIRLGLAVIYECYLVDPASSHMLVSKIKPCMLQSKSLNEDPLEGKSGASSAGSADVAFRTPLAPYEKSKFLGSGGSMVARLKLKGIDGRAPPGVEPAA